MLRVVGGLEQRPQPVIVGVGDRIVPMLVTLSTADGQSEQRRRHDLDDFCNDLVGSQFLVGPRTAGAVGRHSQEPCRNQPVGLLGGQVLVRRWYQFIAGQLLDDKFVPRLVRIQSPDRVVAVLEGPGPGRILLGHPVAVGITDDIQPVPGPAFAIRRRGQQAIHQSGPGTRRLVGNESLDHSRFRWQAMQIERQPANQCRPVSLWTETLTTGFQFGQQKRVDRRPQQLAVLDSRQWWTPNRPKGPMLPLLERETAFDQRFRFRSNSPGSGIDPASQRFDVLFREPFRTRRHFARCHSLEQPAVAVLDRNNGRPRFSPFYEEASQPCVESPFFLARLAVALPAMGLENRPHIGLEPGSRLLGDHGQLPRQEG